MLHSYAQVQKIEPRSIDPHAVLSYSSSDMAKIYGFPQPSSANVVVGVISLGGGLFGSVDASGVLTNGDVQRYWLSQGISAENHPTVVIVGVDGARNTPSTSDGGCTLENTIDVEMIGSCCPTAKLTIILYIAPNSDNSFYNVFQYAINTPVIVNRTPVTSKIISCSWGLTELYASSTLLTNLNNLFKTASQNGINVCVASGDNGSSDGAPGTNVDFPGSSPYVVCCGGTTLVCPNKIYDLSTVETVWNNNPTTSATGGGISKVFPSPSYQSALAQTKRAVPDIALNSDPYTGVRFLVAGSSMTVGGTSIAAPAFAAFLACSTPPSFVNPLLYSYPGGCFHDIVSGNNGAYSAGVGYDKCTGLGSINGTVLTANITQNIIFATSVLISPSSLNLSTLTPVQLVATVLPTNTIDKSITWTSSNPAIVGVNTTGVMIPIASGSVTITATTKNGKKATISVIVSIPVATSVSISPSSLNLSTLSPVQLVATVLPTNTIDKSITWTSSNPAIVGVMNTTGVVIPIASGSVTITATTKNGKTATIPVIVSMPIKTASISTSLLLSSATATAQLAASILPTNSTNKTVLWSSSNPSVASVSASGLVSAKASGSTVITSTTQDNAKSSTINVTVSIPSNAKQTSTTNILQILSNRNRTG